MEWILTGLIIPVIIGVWQMISKHMDNKKEQEERLDDLLTRVTIVESKISNIEEDITEIKELRDEIKGIRIDISKIITMLDERTKKGP